MTIAVLPGTYDPITVGHVDIVRRASRLFDEVIVAVAHNSTKAPLLGADERVRLAAQAVAEIPGARAVRTDGLIVDFCRTVGADALVKGLRGGADFDAERPMALMNRSLSGIETVFVVGDNALSHVASSLVRDVARHGGDVSVYVPEGVSEAIAAALARA
ncbi:pantetheine-phosphate adenylyltransferase [Demequina litorisediminis]|uniref:Phosphopantetheine adenylyltransferase n=1 Tax=Demequina litorisediminis TaxID=1849022 RepID=A0ABQ6I966_9MICO|nr:pantetheine-phosphate adenylyltransferase [Demequina litorisediminis]GMA34388.1 phosphopantetheine adenylyltransferase [Demequina litorisediminis]